jgi:RNA polymerase sigma-70 factor (ECF subfamily)
VRGVLLARLSPADADDVVQEVFVVAYKKLSSLRDDAAVGAWLCTIARTRAIDHVRKRRPSREDALDDVAGSAREPRAEAVADDVIEAKRVLAVIGGLPEAYRETLVLRLVEGMSGAEIAKQTGLTEGSVRVNLSRGYALLQEALSR